MDIIDQLTLKREKAFREWRQNERLMRALNNPGKPITPEESEELLEFIAFFSMVAEVFFKGRVSLDTLKQRYDMPLKVVPDEGGDIFKDTLVFDHNGYVIPIAQKL